jgi:hypothetical protein
LWNGLRFAARLLSRLEAMPQLRQETGQGKVFCPFDVAATCLAVPQPVPDNLWL